MLIQRNTFFINTGGTNILPTMFYLIVLHLLMVIPNDCNSRDGNAQLECVLDMSGEKINRGGKAMSERTSVVHPTLNLGTET